MIYFKYVLMSQFRIDLSANVGGTAFPDNIANRPWSSEGSPMTEFWNRRDEWLSTWNEEEVAMKIDYVRIYQG
jgi:D-alanyl-lipoteichoic acid acyltransferase DltB (MBOAT superfamily)